MNIAIVGAGLVGRVLAWRLLERGHSVSLFDKDSGAGEKSAAMVAAAMLAPFSEVLDSDPSVYYQGLQGFSVWKEWIAELESVTGVDIDLRLTGSLVLAHRNDMGDYQRFVARLRSHSHVDQNSVSELDQVALTQIEPELAHQFNQACFLEKEGSLDNHALFQSLSVRIHQLKAEWHYGCHIDDIDAALDNELKGFDKVVDCRGFSPRNAIQNLRGVRGEIVRVHAPEVNLSRSVRLMHPRYKLYISPKPNHCYVIGATQIESSAEHGVTVRSSLELLSALYSVHSGFSEAEILSQSARCRPAYVDNLPRIECRDKLIRINGLYRHGYLLAPQVIQQSLTVIEGRNDLIEHWPDIVHMINESMNETVA